MATKASKTVADYRERASRVRALAATVMSASVRRALLNVADRYDEIADDAAGARPHRPSRSAPR
jgi:hypothetical protein